jgi:hypothetical protein
MNKTERELLTNEELITANKKMKQQMDNMRVQISEYQQIVQELSDKLEKTRTVSEET